MKKIEMVGDRKRVYTVNTQRSRTQKQFADQCDVNQIVAKYKTTGQWQHMTNKQGVYADVSEITDYHSSVQKVLDANNAFMALPSTLRARFGNDPGELLAFLQDPKNREEAIKLGLIDKKAEPKPRSLNVNDLNDLKEALRDAPAKSSKKAEASSQNSSEGTSEE